MLPPLYFLHKILGDRSRGSLRREYTDVSFHASQDSMIGTWAKMWEGQQVHQNIHFRWKHKTVLSAFPILLFSLCSVSNVNTSFFEKCKAYKGQFFSISHFFKGLLFTQAWLCFGQHFNLKCKVEKRFLKGPQYPTWNSLPSLLQDT